MEERISVIENKMEEMVKKMLNLKKRKEKKKIARTKLPGNMKHYNLIKSTNKRKH